MGPNDDLFSLHLYQLEDQDSSIDGQSPHELHYSTSGELHDYPGHSSQRNRRHEGPMVHGKF